MTYLSRKKEQNPSNFILRSFKNVIGQSLKISSNPLLSVPDPYRFDMDPDPGFCIVKILIQFQKINPVNFSMVLFIMHLTKAPIFQ